MNQVPWKFVFVVGAIFVVAANVFHMTIGRSDDSRCKEYLGLNVSGIVEFSGLKPAFSGGKYALLTIKTSQGVVKIDLGLDPVIHAGIKAGDSIRLEGDGRVVLATGERYILIRCRN